MTTTLTQPARPSVQVRGLASHPVAASFVALGVIIYEMFTGVTPFVGDTLQAVMTGHLFRQPPRLVDLPASLGVPAAIAEIVDGMLEHG